MYKVISQFKDKFNPQHFYSVGDEFISADKMRINDLLSRQLIEEIKEDDKVNEVKAMKKKSKAGD